ncbi:hypothetical protein BC359_17050 [Priestia flexa]|nr:hypothetical protein BC359_17050 [Priestia flexa]
MRKRVIVIGAGPGGLAAAMLLAGHGYQVHVFEKQPYVGGRNASIMEHAYGVFHPVGGVNQLSKAMAKVFQEHGGAIHLNQGVKKILVENKQAKGVLLENGEKVLADQVVVNGDFAHAMTNLFDEGPTIVLLPKMLTTILEEAGISSNQYELIQCDPLYKIHFADGTTYTKRATEEEQFCEIERSFPGESENYKRFMVDMKKRFEVGEKAFSQKSFVNKWDFWTWQNVKFLKQLNANQSMHKFVSRYFNDQRLASAYALQSLYIGGNPYSSPAIYSLIPYSEHAHGIFYVKGAMQAWFQY